MHTFSHGIHPPEHKDTAASPIRRFPFAPCLILPLSQHIGAPAKALVHEGQEVKRGERIAEPGGFVSVPYHAPVTGIVRKLGLVPTAMGKMVPGIYLEPQPGSGQSVLAEQPLDPESADADAITDAVWACGMTGLGGASFPTHVKFRLPPKARVDTLLLNGAECEPYLTADHRVMLERAQDIFCGIRLILRATGATRAVIGVEHNKRDAVAELRSHLPKGLPISVEMVQVKYPQGAEKMLIEAILGRKVPPGKLPLDIGVVVSNVSTMAELGALLPAGQGLIERVLTVAGPGIRKPGNYIVPIGTPVRFILDQLGLTEDAGSVILGGPMMGQALANLDVPVTKGTSGLVVLRHEEQGPRFEPARACIRCGHCLDACPMFLNPAQLGRLARSGAYEPMRANFHLMDCFECGSCSFVCPSRIPLVQQFRLAKSYLRDNPDKAAL